MDKIVSNIYLYDHKIYVVRDLNNEKNVKGIWKQNIHRYWIKVLLFCINSDLQWLHFISPQQIDTYKDMQ